MRSMALLHRAELHPTKLELLAAWLPGCDWYQGPAGEVVRVAGYRFDDPEGEVGIETILVRAGTGPVHQVPLTYRGAPLDGGDGWLVGTTDHSVLGRRWVYDACGDPVYVAALASAILADTGQATEYVEVDGQLTARAPTLIETDLADLAVLRRLDVGEQRPGLRLTGTWAGQPEPLPLAYAAPR